MNCCLLRHLFRFSASLSVPVADPRLNRERLGRKISRAEKTGFSRDGEKRSFLPSRFRLRWLSSLTPRRLRAFSTGQRSFAPRNAVRSESRHRSNRRSLLFLLLEPRFKKPFKVVLIFFSSARFFFDSNFLFSCR